MKTINCPNEPVEVRVCIGDVVWTGITYKRNALATTLVLWTDEIEAQLFLDEQERIVVRLADGEADKIVGVLIDRKLRELRKKESRR